MVNKRCGVEGLFIIAAISIAIIIFFGVWIFGMNIVTEKLLEIDSPSAKVNISEAAQLYMVPVNDAYGILRLISFVMLFGLSLSFVLTNFFIKAHPYLYVVYIFITNIEIKS